MLAFVTIYSSKGIKYPLLLGDAGEMSNKAGKSKLMTKETAGEKSKQRNNAANESVEESNLSTEDAARACKTNNEGLVYIEVDFTNQSKRSRTNQAPVIHGEDNRTEYTFVDFSKKAPPITDADDKEEDQEERQVRKQVNREISGQVQRKSREGSSNRTQERSQDSSRGNSREISQERSRGKLQERSQESLRGKPSEKSQDKPKEHPEDGSCREISRSTPLARGPEESRRRSQERSRENDTSPTRLLYDIVNHMFHLQMTMQNINHELQSQTDILRSMRDQRVDRNR
uniref:Uncharacterized protein n=1 Tax=Magallana gigas TaxID=29159 RepID=K1RIS7_MAGGI